MGLGSVVRCAAGRGRNGWWEQRNSTDRTYVIPLKFLAAATITCSIFRHPLTVCHLHTPRHLAAAWLRTLPISPEILYTEWDGNRMGKEKKRI